MTSLLDKLNLRPGERRLVVFVALFLFVVLNIWLVRPQFGQVGVWKNRRDQALTQVARFNSELGRKAEYEKTMTNLTRLGSPVPAAEQAIQLQKDIVTFAALTGVTIENQAPIQRQGYGGRTNTFFEEQTLRISVNTGEGELVDFLYNLGKRNSLIRVRTMNLRPDPARMRLKGELALVASYQKKAPPRTVAAAAGATKPATTKPATSTAKTNVLKTNVPPATKTTSAPPKTTTTTVKPPSPSTVVAAKTNAIRRAPPAPPALK